MKLPLRIFFAVLICICGTRFHCAAQTATNLWSLQLSHYDCDSSPALAPDGTIYQAEFDSGLFAITPEGEIKWAFKAGSEIKSSPAIADDGTIYFGARDRKLYAVTPQGKMKWTFATGAWVDSSPAIGADGTIYFGSWDTNFYALNPGGSLKWKFPTGGIVDSSPAIGADGTIYFGSHDKNFYALMPDGKLRWKFPTRGQISSSPALNSDGTIYFTSTDGNFYALNSDGSEKWHLQTGGATESSPVIDASGDIFVAVNNFIFMISADGKKMWSWGAALLTDPSCAVAEDGLIYFPASWRRLVAFKTDGSILWHADTEENISGSPAIGTNGIVYVEEGRFLGAITSTNNSPPAKSSWPMFRGNPQHTGRISLNR
jgi:outer membrane protein assembly factor BamB